MHYILCNMESKSTETRLCQSGIYPAARAMGPAIGVHHAEESLSVHRRSLSVPREGWLGGAIGCALRVVPDGYTCLLRFVGGFACKDMVRGVYIYTSWGY